MKKCFALVLGCLAISFCVQSQTELKYYTYNWKECPASEARFVGAIIKTDSGWVRKDYFLPKRNLQMQGLYKDSNTIIRNGSFYYFHSNGHLASKGKYRNDKKDGFWLSFHPNGMISDSTEYDQGRVIGVSMQWHNNGYASDSTNYNSNPAVHVSWYNDGAISEAGRLVMMDSKVGKWQYFHRNGKMSAEEIYDEGKLTALKYFSEDGSPVADTANKNHTAVFPGGIAGWLRFLERNLYWPPGYQLVDASLAAIGVEFRIDEDGNMQDIFLVTPFDEVFNDIVVRTLKKAPRWTPAVSHNRKVSIVHRQTINFTQEIR